jgi:hypothetical protein
LQASLPRAGYEPKRIRKHVKFSLRDELLQSTLFLVGVLLRQEGRIAEAECVQSGTRTVDARFARDKVLVKRGCELRGSKSGGSSSARCVPSAVTSVSTSRA